MIMYRCYDNTNSTKSIILKRIIFPILIIQILLLSLINRIEALGVNPRLYRNVLLSNVNNQSSSPSAIKPGLVHSARILECGKVPIYIQKYKQSIEPKLRKSMAAFPLGTRPPLTINGVKKLHQELQSSTRKPVNSQSPIKQQNKITSMAPMKLFKPNKTTTTSTIQPNKNLPAEQQQQQNKHFTSTIKPQTNQSFLSKLIAQISSINPLSAIFNPNQEPKSSKGDFRILHGLDAVAGEWPWIVRIELCEPNKECELCTGSLLNDRWLITAGHCVNTEAKQITYKATLGQYDLITPDNSTVHINIDKVIRHPAYQDLTNDISLMRLERAVVFNDFIQPVCLIEPTRDLLAFTHDLTCVNIGYGSIENGMSAVNLQKILIRTRPPNECNSDTLDQVQLRTGTVCMGPPDGAIGGSCHGDSGGPDVCYDHSSDQWLLIGTVSYGPNDCDREQGSRWLTVSVDLTNYRSWIVDTIQKEEKKHN